MIAAFAASSRILSARIVDLRAPVGSVDALGGATATDALAEGASAEGASTAEAAGGAATAVTTGALTGAGTYTVFGGANVACIPAPPTAPIIAETAATTNLPLSAPDAAAAAVAPP